MDQSTIAGRLSVLISRIAAATAVAGRPAESVRLLAVSKTARQDAVEEAYRSGQRLFGENYVQEAKSKFGPLVGTGLRPELHFIGRLQRNKAKDAVQLFDVIQSVDRIELAQAIDDAAAKAGKKQDVFLQVNISAEASKSGTAPDGVVGLAKRIASLMHLRLCGLMAIGSFFEENLAEDVRRSEFRAMRELRTEVQRQLGLELPELSMGMSHDFELAIAEGATLVRIGTALFGERPM